MRPRLLLAAAGAVAAVLAGPTAALAADGTIAHVQSDGATVAALVSVPPGTQVDLARVTATLDGTRLDVTATPAAEGPKVRRTTVLAMDTSESMARAGRFAAAKSAARAFLASVPDDVEVGVVTFDSDVAVALAPTTDRAAADAVVDSLELAKGTLMLDGIAAAVDAAGTEGQRSVLVLSDGADTGSRASLADTTALVRDTGTLVDAVSLDLPADKLAPLRSLAEAGQGRVVESTSTALADAFRQEADVLATQVLVTAPLPDGFEAEQATVAVALPVTSGFTVRAEALATIQQTARSADDARPAAAPLTPPGAAGTPAWMLYVGVGVLGLGALTAALLAVPARPAPMTIAERVEAYSSRASGPVEPAAAARPASEQALEQARSAAANVLRRNRGLDDKLTQRLAAAGSELKPSEWLLVQVGSTIAGATLGLLLGRGNIVLGLLLLVVGAVVPGRYLSMRASRRVKKFQDSLPEVLQMVASALSAGLSLAQAVDVVVREGPEPIASEFKRVLVENRIGISLEDAFDGVAQRFDSRDFAWAVMAIRIQRQVGGNLAELLTTVATTMRDRASLKRHVRALSAEGRMSAMILCGLPPCLLLYLLMTNPTFLEPLYTDARGLLVSGFGLGWLFVGVFWMSRLVKVDL